MAKVVMPKKKEDDVLLPTGQKKPTLHRYWLQVDRQTKASFSILEEAETAAKAIKTAHPQLQVGITMPKKARLRFSSLMLKVLPKRFRLDHANVRAGLLLSEWLETI